MLQQAQFLAFSDELEKEAIAVSRLRVAQSRVGRRPLRVSTLLKKEKEGTLYKKHAEATSLTGDGGMNAFTAFCREIEKYASEESPKTNVLKDIKKKYPQLAKPAAPKEQYKQAEQFVLVPENYDWLLDKFAGIASGFKTMMTAVPRNGLAQLGKPAAKGFGGMQQLGQAVVKPVANPTLASAGRAARDFAILPVAQQNLLRNSDPVKKWGVTPIAAMQVADMSRQRLPSGLYERLEDSINRNVLHGGAKFQAGVASNAATVAPVRKVANAIAGNYGPSGGMGGLPGVINNTGQALRPPVPPPAAPSPKMASVAGTIGSSLASKPGVLRSMGEHLATHGNLYDLAGLGLLATPSAISLSKQVRNKAKGEKMDKHQTLHDLAELGGLGLIAAPVAASTLLGRGGH